MKKGKNWKMSHAFLGLNEQGFGFGVSSIYGRFQYYVARSNCSRPSLTRCSVDLIRICDIWISDWC